MVDLFMDAMHDAAEIYKTHYAKSIIKLNKPNDYKLSDLGQINTRYKSDIYKSNIYICFITRDNFVTKTPYITDKFPDSEISINDIKYHISLYNQDPEWAQFVFKYLKMINYAFSTASDLVDNARISKDPFIQEHVQSTYLEYQTLIKISTQCQTTLIEIDN